MSTWSLATVVGLKKYSPQFLQLSLSRNAGKQTQAPFRWRFSNGLTLCGSRMGGWMNQGWAGMTFGSSGTGTGMDNSIPEVREREGNWKNPFPQFGNGKGMKKNHSQNSGMGREWKNLFPKFGNGKGMKKIHSHNSGMGIRGYHSQEFPGTGMKKHNMTIKEKYLANMWREKEFWPKHS